MVDSGEVEHDVNVGHGSFVFVDRLLGVGNASFPVSGSTTNVAVTTPCVGLMASGLPSQILYTLRIADAVRNRKQSQLQGRNIVGVLDWSNTYRQPLVPSKIQPISRQSSTAWRPPQA